MAEERVQRRLAAILAADVVGYSRLVEADETGTLASFKGHLTEIIEPALSTNQGRLVKTMGDGVLAEFASAVDAVLCARSIQEAVKERNAGIPEERQLRFRIGVNVGDIVIDGDDIHGDGVNIAARLEGIAQPDGICISGTVYDQVQGKLDLGFANLGEQNVKNIDRPIRAYTITDAGEAATSKLSTTAPWKKPVIAAVAAALIAVAGGTAWWQPWVTRVEPASIERMAVRLPEKPSIAVLSFSDFSEKKDQEFFADGLTEEIISNLATFENIFVIARNSTNKFKGKPVDVRTVAEDLGVRYVLEGSIRRAGDNLRVSAQLIDAINGRHIWAAKYDRKMKDIFVLQEEITGEIASRLVSKVELAEFQNRSRKGTRNPKAYELFLLGWNLYNQTNPKANARAIKLFEQAIQIDPNYARAYSQLAYARRHNAVFGWGKEAKDSLEHALELARKAVALDSDDSFTHAILAQVLQHFGDLKPTIEEFEKAIALSPGNPDPLVGYSITLALAGREKDAVRNIEAALRLNPYASAGYPVRAGITFYMAREFEKSAAILEKARRIRPNGRSFAYAIRAAAFAKLGKMDEARKARENYLRINPKYFIRAHLQRLNYPEGPRRLLAEGLKLAGYPERPPLKLPDKPSIAVLPFANMSGNKSQEYFSDGITEDIITDLSKVSGLFVIARTSTNRYKGKSPDIRKIARDLGVRYIVKGSVRKTAGRVRITAQLIDAITGNHVWAERYDRKLKDIFAIQDDVAENVVSKLRVELLGDERSRIARIPTDNPEAYDIYLRGVATVLPPRPKNLADAARLFEKVIALDPDFAGGYAGLSFVYTFRFKTGLEGQSALDRALQLAEKALALDDTLYMTNRAAGVAYSNSKRLDEALAVMKRTLELEPGNAAARTTYAYFLARAGRASDGIKEAKLARRLSPSYVSTLDALGRNYFFARQYKDAIRSYENYQTLQPRLGVDQLSLMIAAYAMAGQERKAKAAVKRLLTVNSKFTVSFIDRTSHYKLKEDRDHILTGLRRAGVPEGEPEKPKAPPLSIVVLPFDNLSGDPKQDYFADGITEDLITDLSRIKDAFVIARGTSFTYRGKTVDPKQVAQELNVRYVLEGSVRRSGDQVRVNAQLIDGKTSAHIWSDRFDRTVKNVFSLQNEITGRLAAILKTELLEAESRQSKRGPPANLEAWDYALQGYVGIMINVFKRGPKGDLEAIALLKKAVEMDPDIAIAWTGLAHGYYIAAARGLPGILRKDARRLALQAAGRAVALDPKSADAKTELGLAYRMNNRPEKGLATCNAAIKINPNHDDAYMCVGSALTQMGKPLSAIPHLKAAGRLNPYMNAYRRHFFVGRAYLFAGKFKQAATAFRKGIADRPNWPTNHAMLAAALGHLGRIEDAKATYDDYLRTGRTKRDTIAAWSKPYAMARWPYFERFLDGLRKTGVPEK